MALRIPKHANRYGLDIPYFVRWLNRIIPALDSYTPAEFARELGRMAAAADKEALIADQQSPALQELVEAAINMDNVKGRHHSQIAMERLSKAAKAFKKAGK